VKVLPLALMSRVPPPAPTVKLRLVLVNVVPVIRKVPLKKQPPASREG
jgi:hypothetical protein